MRFLFATIGSHGDVHPLIAVAQALVARGHEAIIAANPHFESLIRGAGVAFAPIGRPMAIQQLVRAPGAMAPVAGTLRLIRSVVLPALQDDAASFDDALRTLRPDLAVLHPLCLAGAVVCEQHRVPFAVAMLAPLGWWNPHDSPASGPWSRTSHSPRLAKFGLFVGRGLSAIGVDPGVNRLRRERGLQAGSGHFVRLCRGGIVNLGLWSPHFRALLEGDPPAARVCGFTWFDQVHEREEESAHVERFFAGGPAPIAFTLGTASVHVAERFYEDAAEACARLGRRGLLLVGRREYGPRRPGPDVAVVEYAAFSRVFPRCEIVVHHGGIGTTAQALRAGRPALVVPMSHDQFDNAARVWRLGVGQRLRHAKCTADLLVARLRTLFDEPQYFVRAAELATKLATEDGAGCAAEALIHAAARGSPA